jgi:hypothetical protein
VILRAIITPTPVRVVASRCAVTASTLAEKHGGGDDILARSVED